MTVYVDTCVAVSLFTDDAHTARADAWLVQQHGPLILSTWAVTEFSSALGVQRRRGALNAQDRLAAEAAFDGWLSSPQVRRVDIGAVDFTAARQLMRFDTVPLRAGDALHLAVAMRLGVAVATLDDDLAAVASAAGLSISEV